MSLANPHDRHVQGQPSSGGRKVTVATDRYGSKQAYTGWLISEDAGGGVTLRMRDGSTQVLPGSIIVRVTDHKV